MLSLFMRGIKCGGPGVLFTTPPAGRLTKLDDLSTAGSAAPGPPKFQEAFSHGFSDASMHMVGIYIYIYDV